MIGSIAFLVELASNLNTQPPARDVPAPDPRPIAAMIEVRIQGERIQRGTGVIVGQLGDTTYIVTAAHVVVSPNSRIMPVERVDVRFWGDTAKRFTATIRDITADSTGIDLAVLSTATGKRVVLDSPGRMVLAPPRTDSGTVGHTAFISGFVRASPWSTSPAGEAIVQSTEKAITVDSRFVGEGASGGPLMSQHGALIGMVQRDADFRAVAMPIARVMEWLGTWRVPVSLTSNPVVPASTALDRLKRQGLLDVLAMREAVAANRLGIVRDVGDACRFLEPQFLRKVFQGKAEATENRTIARLYLESTRDSAAASFAWIGQCAKAGFDVNLMVPGVYYDEESLLIAAVRAHNRSAVRELLAAGASAHGRQTIGGTRFSEVRMVSPLNQLFDSTFAGGTELVRDFVNAGLVFPSIHQRPEMAWESVMYGIKKERERYRGFFGREAPLSPELSKGGEVRVCQQAARWPTFDWCQFVTKSPRAIKFRGRSSAFASEFGTGLAVLRHFLAGDATTLVFLASVSRGGATDSIDEYAIVEASADGSKWSFFLFDIYSDSPCKREEGGFIQSACWVQLRAELVP